MNCALTTRLTLTSAAPSMLTRLSERSKLFLTFASPSPLTREFIAAPTPMLNERGESPVTDADDFDDRIPESDQTSNRFLHPVPVIPELKGDLRDAPRTLVDWASLKVFPICFPMCFPMCFPTVD